MRFIFPSLTWAFFLLAIPVLIHLINMMRHRRVKWAAMEFLLQSHKRHRKWIWLRQLLLLLLRMAAVAAVVAMLAQLVSDDRWSALFGGEATHHFVLLDDSYSMSDRIGETTAFDRAKQVLRRIADGAANQEPTHKFTLIRFSQAARWTITPSGAPSGDADRDTDDDVGDAAAPREQAGRTADLSAEAVDGNFDLRLEEIRRGLKASKLSVGASAALKGVQQLLDETMSENQVVYVISDFRAKEWESPAELREDLRQLEQVGAELHLVNCVNTARPNLVITDLSPSAGTRAAGVPLFMNVAVKNFGQQTAKGVQLKIKATHYDRAKQDVSRPGLPVSAGDELPTVFIDEIEPGQTAQRRVQVHFPAAGAHVVQANLPPGDAVAADDERWCVVDFPDGVPVLVVEDGASQRHAYYLRSAIQPGPRAQTGLRPEVRPATFLRDIAPDTLNAYHAVYLLNVPRLDQKAVDNLQDYVRAGGGLAIFMGSECRVGFYNRLHDQGRGLFPLPLASAGELDPKPAGDVPDLEFEPHPLFDVFRGERNPFVRGIAVHRFYNTTSGWAPEPDSTVRVLARLRNGMPLVVERKFGDGRVVAFLTPLAPGWNNWAQDPSFVIVLLQLQSYLASQRGTDLPRLVGTPLTVQLDATKYRSDLTFVTPGDQPAMPNTPAVPQTIERRAVKPADESAVLIASLGSTDMGGGQIGETDATGIYEAWAITSQGDAEVRRYALNVEPTEGDLAIVTQRQLADKLNPVKFQYHRWQQFQADLAQQAGFNWSRIILLVLVGLLLVEQLMAYLASYHPARGGAR